MCGVVGYFGLDLAKKNSLQAMLSALRSRGPDDEGYWAEGAVGLAHARLSILDPSPRGHQPFQSSDGRYLLSYNGEVYNFKELRAKLEDQNITFASDTDTEVVLAAIVHWGLEGAVKQFNGMFAFAFYDRQRQVLSLARDRMGIKPLYVSHIDGGIVFGSEIKALLAHPCVPNNADPYAVNQLLLHQRFSGSRTLHAEIEAIAPGSIGTFEQGQWRSISYYDLEKDIEPERIVKKSGTSPSDLSRSFEEIFSASVERHLVSDVPVATMCSGGVDSSLVTAVARSLGYPIVSYVADIESMDGQEVARARMAADAIGVELNVVNVSKEDYFLKFPEAILANDQPMFFNQDVAAMLVAKKLNADGYKVVLTGDGADEVFGGYDRYAQSYHRWKKRNLQSKLFPNNRLTRLLGKLNGSLQSVDLDALALDPLGRWRFSQTPVGLGADLVEGVYCRAREQRIFARMNTLPWADRAFLTHSFIEVYEHLRERLSSLDNVSMHHSVETRVPFLDTELLDFGFHLPVAAKYRSGVTKWILKTTAEKYLPSSLLHKPKIGFELGRDLWRGTAGFLSNGQISHLLKWKSNEQTEILKLVSAKPYYLSRVVGLEVWLRLRQGESPVALGRELLSHANQLT